jgi:SAM-dependent MidA family methyltransferase
MKEQPVVVTDSADVRRISRLFPTFRDFVDDALFDPRWGYYSTGQVRFGEGGHYDTFPLALAPVFGAMVAGCAYRLWRRVGQPAYFEICELGAGNGQLCLDVLVALDGRAGRAGPWQRFARALRYRIVERSRALIKRQHATLGVLAGRVEWTHADLSRRRVRRAAFAASGLIIANEVLDCLAHHKIVPATGGDGPGVVYVVPVLRGPKRPRGRGRRGSVPGVQRGERPVPRARLARVLANRRLQRQLAFREVVVPLRTLPRLRAFVRRHYPEFFAPRAKFPAYFACPAIERILRNTARLYHTSEMLWIDYGGMRRFHLTSSENRRVFAGPPRSGASVYRAPGADDITFMVDFSVVAAAAQAAGLDVRFYGGQAELARRSGVQLNRRARELILRYRTLGWMLAVVGVGPERAWRQSGLTWKGGRGGRLRADVGRSVAEFLGKEPSGFKLMILAK